MKILYHHRIKSKDGQAVHIEELIAALRRRGAEVVLACPEGFSQNPFGHDPKLLSRLKAGLPRSLYEILELGYNIPASFRLIKAWRRSGTDVLYERYNLYLLAGVILKRLFGVPLLLEVNAPLARERATYDGLALKGLARRLERWVWCNADYVLAVTQVLADEIAAAGVSASAIRVVPNGTDLAGFATRPNPSAAKAALCLTGKCVVGFTGFMRDWHGLDMIVDWLASPTTPKDVYVLLIGDGPAKTGLQAQAARLGIAERLRFTGLVDRHQVGNMMAAFDIALQPKCVAYASPLKLFEYMALGKAIVAPNQPNIREVLDDGVSAVLFDPDEPGSLVAAIERLVRDPVLRDRLGAQAQSSIQTRGLTWDENARRVLELANIVARQTEPAATDANRPHPDEAI